MDLAKAYVQIIPSTKGIEQDLTSALSGAGDSAGKSAGGKFSSAFGKMAKAGAVGVAAASTAAVAFGKSAVDAGLNFDSAMSQVAATMGKTVDEIDDLRVFAQEMGASTAFSASQAAEALNYMALAGYDANTSMEMLPNVLNLAAAGGMELGRASDMVTDAQTALGLSLSETSVMVDQMAKASSTTNTSVSQLGDAFLTIGGNAKNLSGGTAELSAVLGALADNGIKGSEAGTHLRNILLSMTPKSEDAADAFERLGVNAYDSQGKMRNLEDIFLEMGEAMKDMTDQERTNLLSVMFNKTDLASVNALLATTSDRWSDINSAIADASGSAQAMADTQLDNLQGDMTLFKSALEGAQIAVSDMLTPALRDFVTMGTEGLSEVTSALMTGDFGEVMNTIGAWLSDVLVQLTAKVPQLVDAGQKLLMGLVNGIITNLPQIADAALQAVLTLAQGISQNLPTLIPAAIDAILTVVEGLIDNIDLVIDAGIQLIVGLAEGLIAAIPRIIEKTPVIIAKLIEGLAAGIPKIAQAGVDLLISLVKNLPAIIAGIVKTIPQILAAVIKSFMGYIKDMANVGINLMKGLGEGLISGLKWVLDKVKSVGGAVLDFFSGIFKINSPSKVTMGFGASLDEGLAMGIERNAFMATDAMADMSDSLTNKIGAVGLSAGISPSYGAGQGTIVEVPRQQQTTGQQTAYLMLDREVLGRVVYSLNNSETQRIGVQLAGGLA